MTAAARVRSDIPSRVSWWIMATGFSTSHHVTQSPALSPQEQQTFDSWFRLADSDGDGMPTGDIDTHDVWRRENTFTVRTNTTNVLMHLAQGW